MLQIDLIKLHAITTVSNQSVPCDAFKYLPSCKVDNHQTIRVYKRCTLFEIIYLYHHYKSHIRYRQLVKETVERFLNDIICKQLDYNSSNRIPVELVICFIIEQWDLETIRIDTTWCLQILKLAIIRMEIEETLSWLSTLGGAFSSLGDLNIHFAKKAGQISISQLKMSFIYGDPNLTGRCFIYISHSLCQQGYRANAIRFVRKCVYPYLVNMGDHCERIVKQMYKALCFRIRFIYL